MGSNRYRSKHQFEHNSYMFDKTALHQSSSNAPSSLPNAARIPYNLANMSVGLQRCVRDCKSNSVFGCQTHWQEATHMLSVHVTAQRHHSYACTRRIEATVFMYRLHFRNMFALIALPGQDARPSSRPCASRSPDARQSTLLQSHPAALPCEFTSVRVQWLLPACVRR